MKKCKNVVIASAAIVVAAVIGITVWWILPKSFLNGIEPGDVKVISVFNGNTGVEFEISDADEINQIVENIKDVSMKKSGISLGVVGYSFRLRFLDGAGRELESFVLNSPGAIRKDPFFYGGEGLCYGLLEEIEGRTEG